MRRPAKPKEKLTFELELITPTKAGQYLASGVENVRHISKKYIDEALVPAYDRKDFVLTGNNNIVFDKNGALIDGYHRLTAVISWGHPVWMVVCRGARPEAKGYFDMGRPRSAAQITKLVLADKLGKIKNVTKVVAAAVVAHNLDHKLLGLHTSTRPPRDQIPPIVKANPFLHEAVSGTHPPKESAKTYGKHHSMLAGFVTAAVHAGHPKSRVFEFVRRVYNANGEGYPLGKNDPSRKLSMELGTSGVRRYRNEALALTIKAFNLWIKDKAMREKLRITEDEDFPEIIEAG